MNEGREDPPAGTSNLEAAAYLQSLYRQECACPLSRARRRGAPSGYPSASVGNRLSSSFSRQELACPSVSFKGRKDPQREPCEYQALSYLHSLARRGWAWSPTRAVGRRIPSRLPFVSPYDRVVFKGKEERDKHAPLCFSSAQAWRGFPLEHYWSSFLAEMNYGSE